MIPILTALCLGFGFGFGGFEERLSRHALRWLGLGGETKSPAPPVLKLKGRRKRESHSNMSYLRKRMVSRAEAAK